MVLRLQVMTDAPRGGRAGAPGRNRHGGKLRRDQKNALQKRSFGFELDRVGLKFGDDTLIVECHSERKTLLGCRFQLDRFDDEQSPNRRRDFDTGQVACSIKIEHSRGSHPIVSPRVIFDSEPGYNRARYVVSTA